MMPTVLVSERRIFTQLDQQLEIRGVVDESGVPSVEFRLLRRPADSLGAADFHETPAIVPIPLHFLELAMDEARKVGDRTRAALTQHGQER
jgi:hypothetical protein